MSQLLRTAPTFTIGNSEKAAAVSLDYPVRLSEIYLET